MAKPKTKLEQYLQRKTHELTSGERQQIIDRINRGDGNVYKLADEFGCVPTQVAGIKARLKF
jgi:hypothetical protein